MSFKTDYARVNGLGSARDGTGHWISQRLTAVALIVLLVLFIVPFARGLGAGYDAVLMTYRNPFNAIVALLTIIAGFRHIRLGVQVVIEDYVPAGRHQVRWLVVNALLWRGFMVAGIFAILKIAFSA